MTHGPSPQQRPPPDARGQVQFSAGRATGRWIAVVAWTGWAVCVAAVLLIITVEVRTVCASGPAILAIGVLELVMGWRRRYRALALLGLANVGVVALFVAPVYIFRWMPGDALIPFVAMGLVYTVATLPAVRWVAAHAPLAHSPWECARCGYLLFGLPEPRCPECGTPFDPSRISDLKSEI